MRTQDTMPLAIGAVRRAWILQGGLALAVGGLVSLSAVVTKELVHRAGSQATLVPLASVSLEQISPADTASEEFAQSPMPAVSDPLAWEPLAEQFETAEPDALTYEADTSIRFFNGRPVRPARTIRMKVTAYSPDERSCPGTADGITSSNHDVFTNAMRLAAADSRLLPLGSIISVPGYDDGRVIPVLDRGGAIKGRRLDLLYATHEQALRWGVKTLDVTVWEYADGLPHSDYRKVRDSRPE